MILYKRNASGKPISWEIDTTIYNSVKIEYGLVGGKKQVDDYIPNRTLNAEIVSKVNQKRKEGYKEISELHDESVNIDTNIDNILAYLNTYLPKNNTSVDGLILPMLCKTLKDEKPFINRYYVGQWKINGERCIIGAVKSNDIFKSIRLTFQSRTGTKWNLPHLEDVLLVMIPKELIDMMVEEDVKLDGEVYLPGYGINDINSFIKNPTMPQHKILQFWCYDIIIENMIQSHRLALLLKTCSNHLLEVSHSLCDTHLNNDKQFVLLETYYDIDSLENAEYLKDLSINAGFEGCVLRDVNEEYGFDKRNNRMLKFKNIYDGKFKILDIIPEGTKRISLPKFICENDVNGATFETTIKGRFSDQERYLFNKDLYIGKYLFVEYRERSGVEEVPFHAKGCYVVID